MVSKGAEHRGRRMGWRTRDILRTLAIIAGFYLTLRLLWAGRTIVLLTFLGVLFGVALTAGVDRLERSRVPRAVGATLLVITFLGALAGLGALTAPSIAGQLRDLRTKLPDAVAQIQRWVDERERGLDRFLRQVTPEKAPGTSRQDVQQGDEKRSDGQGAQDGERRPAVSVGEGIAQQIGGIGQHFFSFFSSTLAVLGGLILVLFVAIFVAIDAETYQDGLMHLFPHRVRARAREVLGATATTLRRWLLTQLVGMVLIGVFTTIVLLLLGVQAAIALGIIAGILEFIPIVGPILSAVPAVAMGFLDGPETALYVVLAYTVIQQVEANLVYPLLMKEGLEIPPVLTIVAQGVMSLVFGFLGLLVAVPMLAAAMVPIKMLYVRDVVGDEVSLPGDGEDGKDRKDGKEGKGGKGGKEKSQEADEDEG